jgi:hypothetical protein
VISENAKKTNPGLNSVGRKDLMKVISTEFPALL